MPSALPHQASSSARALRGHSRMTATLAAGALGLAGVVSLSGNSSAAAAPAQAAETTYRATAVATPSGIPTRRQRAAAVISGYGAWVDLWDYDTARTGNHPAITPATVHQMAQNGVQVLYLQSSRPGGALIADPARMEALVSAARADHLRVVLWYLPTTVDSARDLARLKAAAAYRGVAGVAVDAESPDVRSLPERNRRLVILVKKLHAATSKPVITITPSPTALRFWAPKSYWPHYPFVKLALHSDAFMTMSYWKSHKAKGQTTAADETLGDISRIRFYLKDEQMPLHVIGSPTTRNDIGDFTGMLRDQHVQGGSVYDWASTKKGLYEVLKDLRR